MLDFDFNIFVLFFFLFLLFVIMSLIRIEFDISKIHLEE